MLTIADLERALGDDPVAQRFIDKLTEAPEPAPGMGPCLMWTAATTDGYGAFKVDGKRVQAHVWLFKRLHGDVPAGHELAHQCDPEHCPGGGTCPHRACVAHVVPKTHADNVREGAGFAGAQSRRTRCRGQYAPRDEAGAIIGHDLTDPANVYIAPSRPGQRICRPCAQLEYAAWAERARLLRARSPHPASEQLSLI
jgi:hypothetical protein